MTKVRLLRNIHHDATAKMQRASGQQYTYLQHSEDDNAAFFCLGIVHDGINITNITFDRPIIRKTTRSLFIYSSLFCYPSVANILWKINCNGFRKQVFQLYGEILTTFFKAHVLSSFHYANENLYSPHITVKYNKNINRTKNERKNTMAVQCQY